VKEEKLEDETETKISLIKTQIFFNIIRRLGLLEDEAKETTSLRELRIYPKS
jgi:hypothetical protein